MQPAQNPTTSQSPTAPSDGAAAPAQALTAVILAGRLRQAPLQEALNLHLLCLPVGRSGTLLEAWIAALGVIPNLKHTRVVVNDIEDATAVRAVLPREHRMTSSKSVVDVLAEPKSWRGAGGIIRDVTEGLPDDAIVLVCEGTRLPPRTLEPLLAAITTIDAKTGLPPAGVVGVMGEDTPAGAYVFRRKAVRVAPRVGYFDLKEQFLPALAKAGERVVIAKLDGESARLRDLETYLDAVHRSLANGRAPHDVASPQAASQLRVSARASVSGSAVLDGFGIIEPGAVIEDGAVVHDSVVLWGATVGGGAIVSRSVVGPLATVDPRARVVREVVARK